MASTVYSKVTKNFNIKVTETDKGWKKIRKELKRLRGAYTDIGLHEGESRPDGTSLAEIGWWNEKGVPGLRKIWNIPPRPFVAGWFDANLNQIVQNVNKVYGRLLRGSLNAAQAVARIGVYAEGGIKEFITALKAPPNAPQTVAKKGSSSPLIDEGIMRGAIKHKDKVGRT